MDIGLGELQLHDRTSTRNKIETRGRVKSLLCDGNIS